MSDSDLAVLSLGSPNAPIEISVVDWTFREVARGTGAVNASVRPGIYQIVCRAGPSVTTSFVTVGPGEHHEDHGLKVGFPSAAPVEGTTTSHEYHQDAVRSASQSLRDVPYGRGALIVMMRNVRGGFRGGVPSDLLVFDQSMQPGREFPLHATSSSEADGWAIWAGALAPGGYCLRSFESPAFDQSVWVSADWQTLVFVPVTEAGAALEWASVHMVRTSDWWEPFDERTGLAVELALWGLRDRRSIGRDDLLDRLVNSKWGNPMLGIIGAHAMLAEPSVDEARVDHIVGNLAKIVPGHPDVFGLAARLAKSARDDVSDVMREVLKGTVAWPPMLNASYDAVVRRDSAYPGTITSQSVADRASAQRLAQGAWTAWTAPLQAPRQRTWVTRGGPEVSRSSPSPISRSTLPERASVDPETERLRRHLYDLAELGRPLRLTDLTTDDDLRRHRHVHRSSGAGHPRGRRPARRGLVVTRVGAIGRRFSLAAAIIACVLVPATAHAQSMTTTTGAATSATAADEENRRIGYAVLGLGAAALLGMYWYIDRWRKSIVQLSSETLQRTGALPTVVWPPDAPGSGVRSRGVESSPSVTLQITGPPVVIVGEAAGFEVAAAGGDAQTVAWAVEPPTAAKVDPAQGPSTTLTANRDGAFTVRATLGATSKKILVAASTRAPKGGSLPYIGVGYGGLTIAIVAITVAAALTSIGVFDDAALATLLGTVVSYFFVSQREEKAAAPKLEQKADGTGANPAAPTP